VEISHANLPEVTRMVFVEIGSVMMLSTGHTTSTRMLSVFANTTMTCGDMATTVRKELLATFLDETVTASRPGRIESREWAR